jgi:predicted dehydrogenase
VRLPSPPPALPLVGAAAAAGVALGVSHNQVFYAAHAEAKRLIDGGALGRDATLRLAGLESLFFGYCSGPALSVFRDRQWRDVPVPPDDWAASVQASVTAYLDAVSAGREPPVTGAAALESVGLLQRIYDTAAVLPGPADLG